MSVGEHATRVNLASIGTSTTGGRIAISGQPRLTTRIVPVLRGTVRPQRTFNVVIVTTQHAVWAIGVQVMGERPQLTRPDSVAERRPRLVSPALQRLAARVRPQLFLERGDAEESAQEDRRLMEDFASLRRAASDDR